MKFKAHIKLSDKQKLLDRVKGLPEREFVDFEFTFHSLLLNEQLYYMNSVCNEDTMQILIPWLMEGNQPEIVGSDSENRAVQAINAIVIDARERFALNKKYILDSQGNPVRCDDVLEWGEMV